MTIEITVRDFLKLENKRRTFDYLHHTGSWGSGFIELTDYFNDLSNPTETELSLFLLQYPKVLCKIIGKNANIYKFTGI